MSETPTETSPEDSITPILALSEERISDSTWEKFCTWSNQWPHVCNSEDFETFFEKLVVFACSEQDVPDVQTRINLGYPLEPTFNEAQIRAIAGNTEVWNELKDVFVHAKVVDAWLDVLLDEPVAMNEEERKSATVLAELEKSPALLSFSKDEGNGEIFGWILKPLVEISLETHQVPFDVPRRSSNILF